MSNIPGEGAAKRSEDGCTNNINIVVGTAASTSINNVVSPRLEMDPKKLYKKSGGVKYMECLKNHAAAIGGSATDGCGEFMAGGEEGTLEALICSACNCHRNFHRKIHIIVQQPLPPQLPNLSSINHHHHHLQCYHPSSASGVMIRKSSGSSRAAQSDDDYNQQLGLPVMDPIAEEGGGELAVKKRYRTKFSEEQKEKMLSFAEKVAGWKIQKVDDNVVRRFCQEIGIKREVFKVWMHNNKYQFAKKSNTTTTTTTI